jgi:hypothetical protein
VSYISQLVADGAADLWLLDDASGPAASNSIGGGLSAAYGGTFSLGAPGILPGHSSCRFTSGYVQTAADPLVTPFHYTWSVLLRCMAIPAASYFWAYASGGNGNTEYSMLATEPDQTLNMGQTYGANLYTYATTWPSVYGSAWHQVVASWDGSSIRMYLDGALAGITPMATFYRSGTPTLGMGGQPYRGASTTARLDCYMAAAAVFRSALSDAQVANQYQTLALEAVGPVGQPATSGQLAGVIAQQAIDSAKLDAIYAAVHKVY